jgi:hypothetical protein
MAHAERFGNLANVLILAPERKRRGTGDHLQSRNSGEQVRVSSASLSLKYSFSLSALKLAKGSTAIDGCAWTEGFDVT